MNQEYVSRSNRVACQTLGLLSGLALFLCTTVTLAQSADSSPVIRQDERLLTRAYADFRHSQISDVAYSLSINVDEGSDQFSGTARIAFNLTEGNISPVTLDFDEGEILSLEVNGNPGQWQFEHWYISLPAAQFNEGGNEIVVDYRRPYTTDGDGLQKFTDPENGEVYLYTNFEPYNANRFFPLFDQPNLKATFTLDVSVPASWQVISNTRETSIETNDGNSHWQFPATPRLSSYLYALVAGPYTVWEDTSGDIPLRLFARSSLAQYVNTGEWFEPAKEFLPFFQDYYDVPYPFGKYDQIIVPDFNPGAMENPGAVTFNERYVSRGQKSISELNRLAYVIAHEMAHMWFGDLVTMNWWDDLWLNESFATYMGYLALQQTGIYPNAWDMFYSGGKAGAYTADSRITTHPINLEVLNTEDATANFDTITYQKGSSVLKQLPFFIGEGNFRTGVSNYLKAHRFDNATLNDFVASLEQSSGIDLARWNEEWLKTSGVNTVRADFSCSDNRISRLRLIQTVPDNVVADKVLRSQRTQIGLYRYTDNDMVPGNTIPVRYSGAVTWVPDAIGEPCPDLVFPNEADHAFMKIDLDPLSRQTLGEHINDFASSTTRLMLWESLWSSVRDSRLSLDEFVDFVFANIGEEADDLVVRQVSGDIASAFNYYTRFGGHEDRRNAVEDFMWRALQASAPGSEIQKIWMDNFLTTAHTDRALATLLSLLNGEQSIPGITIDQDKRWDIVFAMNRYQYGEYDALLAAEMDRDGSDLGVNSALAVRASRPDEAIKEEFLDTILNEPDFYKVASLRYVITYLFPAEQKALAEQSADRIIAAIPRFNESAAESFLDEYMGLLPATCTPESAARLEQAADDFGDYQALVSRSVLVTLQEDQRCLNIKGLVD